MFSFPSHLSLLAFWPFASAAMLFWGLAALVPIVIHLWNRRRYREVSWAAMEYLLAALRRNSRRILVEQWVLLAIRTLILLLFALALAQPLLAWLPSLGGSLGGGQTHWVMVVDVSYSMATTRDGKTRMERAKELASQLVQQGVQGDGYTLIALGDTPEVIIRTPAFDPKDVLEEIDALRVRHGGARLATGIAEVEAIVSAAREKQKRLTSTQVCIFSDLGRNSWEEVTSDDVRARIGRLAEKASLRLFDVGDNQRQNMAVTRLDVRDSLVALSRETTLEVELQNFGNEPVPAASVELLVDGRRTHTKDVELRPGGKATLAFSHRFDVPGEHRVEARLAADILDVDNHRYASVPVRESLAALCIQGAPGEAKYLAIALQPTRTDQPLVQPVIAPESALVERDLSQFDVVFLVNVGRFSRDEAAVLARYVRQGGGLVVFLGDQVQLESYNEHLTGDQERVLPVRLESLAPTGEYSFNPLDYRHPIVAAFAGHERAGLLTTPVWRYIKLKPLDAARTRIALGFDTGDPAIVTEALGRGRVVVVATAASPKSVDNTTIPPTPWTALPTWPSFPPLVQEMLAYATSGRTAERNVLVGDPLSGVLQNATLAQALEIASPNGRTERVSLEPEGEDATWNFGSTTASGIYEARFGPPREMAQLYAVNVNTRESDLECLDVDLLPSQISTDALTQEAATTTIPTGRPTELFRWFLGSVLLLLVAETILAWRFGSGAR
jgi:hypothetical protein